MTERSRFDEALRDVDTGVYAKRRGPGDRGALRPAVSEQERLLRESRINQACWGLHTDCHGGDHTYTAHHVMAVRIVDLLFPPRVI